MPQVIAPPDGGTGGNPSGAVAESEPADARSNDTALQAQPIAVGATVEGTIGNLSAGPSPDVDHYSFSATAGELIEISVHPGDGSTMIPAFVVSAEGYERLAPPSSSFTSASRQFFIPKTGTYVVMILDFRAVLESEPPPGGPSTTYRMTSRRVALVPIAAGSRFVNMSQSVPGDVSPLIFTFDAEAGADYFAEVRGERNGSEVDAEIFVVRPDTSGGEPVLVSFNLNGDAQGGNDDPILPFQTAASGPHLLVVDFRDPGIELRDFQVTLHPVSQASKQLAALKTQLSSSMDAAGTTVSNVLVTGTQEVDTGGRDAVGWIRVQADPTGPALRLNIAPSTSNPEPKAGDVVSFTVDTTMEVPAQGRVVTGATFTVHDSGVSLEPLLQPLDKATDLLEDPRPYVDEVLSLSVRVSATPGFSLGAPARSDTLVLTDGISEAPGIPLTFLGPEAQALQLDLSEGCELDLVGVSLGAPPRGTPYLQVHHPQNFRNLSCPPPSVVLALSVSDEIVGVAFNRRIDPASILPDGSQFAMSGNLVVNFAEAIEEEPRVVMLRTAPQTPSQPYTVTVASTVRDRYGVGVAPPSNTATFRGFDPHLVVNEVDYVQHDGGSRDFVEIYNGTMDSLSLENMVLVIVDGADSKESHRVDLSQAGSALAPNNFLVVGTADVTVARGGLKIETDFGGGLPARAAAVAIFNTATNKVIDTMSYGALITAGVIDGAPGTYDLSGAPPGSRQVLNDRSDIANSISRCPDGEDTDNLSADFGAVAKPSPGARNQCVEDFRPEPPGPEPEPEPGPEPEQPPEAPAPAP